MARKKATGWDTPLAAPIVLERTTLRTLGDAVAVVLALPPLRQSMPPWHHAAELLQRAHGSGRAADIAAATTQMHHALTFEGWL